MDKQLGILYGCMYRLIWIIYIHLNYIVCSSAHCKDITGYYTEYQNIIFLLACTQILFSVTVRGKNMEAILDRQYFHLMFYITSIITILFETYACTIDRYYSRSFDFTSQ